MTTHRNQPCPCGSGKKAKRCCAAERAPPVRAPAPGAAAPGISAVQAALQRGDRAAAEAGCRAALAAAPGDGNLQQLLGALLLERGQLGEALPLLEAAAQSRPDAGTLYNLGIARRSSGRLEGAVEALRAAVALNPRWIDAMNNLGTCLLDLGFAAEASQVLRRCLDLPGLTPAVFSNLLVALQYLPDLPAAELADAHRRFGVALESGVAPMPRRARDPERQPLRLGLVSGDLHQHPVGALLAGVLPALAGLGFELHAYATHAGRTGDPVTARLRAACAHWTDIQAMDDPTAARRIADGGIDILLDLSGHTGHNRLGVFAHRPAPMQVSWLGYGATTGLTRMDAVLSDACSTPPGDESLFTESLVRLPLPRLPWVPPAEAPDVAPLPMAARGHVTFGAFNNVAKLHPEVIALWASILLAVPGSVLFMKGRQFHHAAPREWLAAAFASHGVEAGRLRFAGFESGVAYLAAYGEVDIALDPFPFTGGMTTLDALWMGVPVVSMRGGHMIARQGEMILTPLGLQDWLCRDAAQYRECAVAAAADPARLAALRMQLRPRIAAAPAADAGLYAAALAAALRQLWRAGSNDAA